MKGLGNKERTTKQLCIPSMPRLRGNIGMPGLAAKIEGDIVVVIICAANFPLLIDYLSSLDLHLVRAT